MTGGTIVSEVDRTAAMNVTAVVDDEDLQPGSAKSQHLIEVDIDTQHLGSLRNSGTVRALLTTEEVSTAMNYRLSSALTTSALGLVLTLGLAPRGVSQEKTGTSVKKGESVTATGCLSQDPKAKDEYMITGQDGKTWAVKSNTLKLNEHLHHKVTITGKVTKAGHESEAGDVNVSELTMLSDTCK